MQPPMVGMSASWPRRFRTLAWRIWSRTPWTRTMTGRPRVFITTASPPPSRSCWWITRAGSRNWKPESLSWRRQDDERRDDHGGGGAADLGGDAASADGRRGGDADALRARERQGAHRQGEPADEYIPGAEARVLLAAAVRRNGSLHNGSSCHAWRGDLAQPRGGQR